MMGMKIVVAICLLSLCIGLANCSKKAASLDNAAFKALPTAAIAPTDNPQSPQKIGLGKLLFWDPILSGGKDVACATCHHASYGYTDNLDLPVGPNGIGLANFRRFILPNDIPFAKRNTPTIVNTAFNGLDVNNNYDPSIAPMFFDMRAKSLEIQCLGPMTTLEEMAGHQYNSALAIDSVIVRLNAIPEYIQLFKDAFGNDSITIVNIEKAIASFERSIISNNASFDKYVRGDASALTSAQIQGMTAFQNSGCINCHSGAMFSDYQTHILSVPDNSKLPTDAGTNATYAFRTPSLRNLKLTAPYMHSGVFKTLDEVLDFYDQVSSGHSQNSHVSLNQLDNKLQRLNKNDKANIIEFLNSLNDDSFDKSIPARVPSNLQVGGNI